MYRLFKSFLIFAIVTSTLLIPVEYNAYAQGVISNPAINKTFTPSSIDPGEISRLTVTIFNPNSDPLHDAKWTDDLISVQTGLRIADVPNETNDCGGSISANPGSTTLSLDGGTVPEKPFGGSDGSCTVGVDVTSTTQGTLTNTIPAGGLTANIGTDPVIELTNDEEATAGLNVTTVAAPSVTKVFTKNTIWVGESTRLTIQIKNNDLVTNLTNVALTDALPGTIILGSPVSPPLTACGTGVLTATAGLSTLSLTNASIAPGATCIIRVNVKSPTQGIYTNTIDAGTIVSKQGVTNASPASDYLNIQSVGLSKAFSPTTFQAGETSTLTITLQNPTTSAYTNVHLTDILPTSPNSNLQFVDGTASTTCQTIPNPATVEVTLPRTLTLSNGTITAGTLTTPKSCTITVQVTTPDNAISATYRNTLPVDAMTADSVDGVVSNVLSTFADVSVQALSVGVSKVFSPSAFQQGGTTTVTITLSNPTSSNFTNVSFTDEFPTGLVPQSASSPDCGGTATFNNTTLPYSVSLSGGTVAARVGSTPGTCRITAQVTGSTPNPYSNTIPAQIVHTDEGITNLTATSGSVTIYPTDQGISASKSFTPSSISAEGNSALLIVVNAPADETLTGFSLSDTLPGNVTISNSTAATITGCGAGAIFTHDTNTSIISLSGGEITQGTSCRMTVYVTSNTSGVYRNTVPTTIFLNDQNQKPPNNIFADLTVSNLTMSKAFYPAIVSPNGLSRLTITLTNTNLAPLVNVSLSDNLNTMGGTAVTVAPSPNAFTNCGAGSFSYTGSQIVTLSNGTVPAQIGSIPGTCDISFDVRATGSAQTRTNRAVRTNVSGTIFSVGTSINPVADATASLVITPLSLSVVKSFNPLTVFGGSSSTLSISIHNPNNAVLTGIKFTDTMPAGMTVANPPNISEGSCSGTLSAIPGNNSFTFVDGVLNPFMRCKLTLSVTMNVNGNRTNLIPALSVTSFNGASNSQLAQASLTNLPGASVSKFFSPNPIVVGNSSLLTITILNTGNIPLSNMGLNDPLPSGLVVSNATVPTNTCGGSFTAEPDAVNVFLTGGSLAAGPGTTCIMTVSVTGTTPGSYLNTIIKNSLSTTEGATNSQPASDTLVLTSAPELQVTKNVTNAGPFFAGDTITYDIIATNQGDIPLTGVVITDPGVGVTLGVCSPVAPASLAHGASMTCSASHLVTLPDEVAGIYTNTAIGDSDQTEPVTDTANVTIGESAAMTIRKISTSSAPHFLGQTLTYDIIVTNIGSDQLTSVTVTDPGNGVTLIGCSPLNGSTLNSGQTMSCTASHIVTQADVDAGSFSNTAIADSNETAPVQDTVNVPITQSPSLQVFKQVTSNPPYIVGTPINFDISVVNTGNQTLHNVTVTDPGVGVTLGACSPVQPATLAQGEILSCSATHVVVQADMDAGGYTNTAFADSDETSPGSDTAVVITKIPTISLSKVGTLDMTVVPPNNVANAGDKINYQFIVTNTGAVTLTNVTVIDIIGGVTITGSPIPTLAPLAVDNTTYSGSYTLTQDDVNSGSFVNTASVTGTPPIGSNVSDTDDETIVITSAPGIELTKTGTLHTDIVVPGTQVNAGDTISYTFTVRNTGNVTLTNIRLTDTVGGITIIGSPIASLAPGESDSSSFTGIYTLTQFNVDAGTYTNTATTSGTPPTGNDVTSPDDDNQTLLPEPSITITKTGTLHLDIVSPDTQANLGDRITYVFTVTNTGNVTLSNVRITDPLISISGGPINLAPGVTDNSTFTGTFTLPQSAIDAGTFTNTALVTGRSPGGVDVTDTDDDTQSFDPFPSIDLQKTGVVNVGSNVLPDAGETISYSFTVRNTGNVTLTNVTIIDAIGGITINGGPIGSLAPGASNNSTFTGTYTLTQSDIDSGSFTNTAQVTGTPPTGNAVTDTDDDLRPLSQSTSIQIVKTGTIHRNIIPPNSDADPGDTITYTLTVTNTGNVTLTDVTVTDMAGGITLIGSPIASMDPGATSNAYTGTYTLKQTDIDTGTFTNTASVTGTPPNDLQAPVDTDDDTQQLGAVPIIGVAKRVIGDPHLVSPGIWDVTFEIFVRNYGNVTLDNIQVTDDLDATFAGPTTFTIRSVSSSDFVINAGYNGSTDRNLLDGSDSLTFEEEGKITLVVRVIPTDSGPFLNTAVAIGTPPTGDPVSDDSQDGIDPDPEPKDGDPTNNNDPTPVDFGPNMFDPPFGVKLLDKTFQPLLKWTMVWINNTNIVAVNAAVSDPIPVNSKFEDDGIDSGYPLPPGPHPDGTVTTGVACVDDSGLTSTQYCYYEGATPEYLRGRIVWTGKLGPDLGITYPDLAVNEISISFHVRVDPGIRNVLNTATIDSDLNGDQDPTDEGEIEVASASATYKNVKGLPLTGFAPSVITKLPAQPEESAYLEMSDMLLEIPSLGIKSAIVGVPLNDAGQWDVTWLGNNVGWLNGTAFPTWSGNSVLTAHVTDPNGKAGLFADLGELTWGNKIVIHSWGQIYTYEVRSVNLKTSPGSLESVIKHEKLPWLTLITCNGYNEKLNNYTWRTVVKAVLISISDE